MFFTLASGRFSISDYWNYLREVFSFGNGEPSQKELVAWEEHPVMAGTRSIGRFEDIWANSSPPKFPCDHIPPQYASQLGTRFILNYGAPISPDDPYFVYLDETAKTLLQAGIRPIMYITPLNKQDIDKFGGADVLAQLNTNLALVRSVGEKKGWELIDLSSALPSAHFITRECGCEHVDSFGRALIARSVATELQHDTAHMIEGRVFQH